MKILKTILGVMLTFGIGKEFVRVGKEYSDFYNPGILITMLLFLLGSAWLIGSGLSKEKIRFISLKYVMYFAVTFILFLLFVFLSLVNFKYEPEIVKVNGINVNIAEFMHGSKDIIPNKEERREYCICVVTKLTTDSAFAQKHKTEFESGNFANVITDLQKGTDSGKLDLLECMNHVAKMNWTPSFEKGMRLGLMTQFKDMHLYMTNDTSELCDCLINQYKKVPMNELNSSEFKTSEKKMRIDSMCYMQSRLDY
jgi:hypothetical protein